jgi:hypothetical protein
MQRGPGRNLGFRPLRVVQGQPHQWLIISHWMVDNQPLAR